VDDDVVEGLRECSTYTNVDVDEREEYGSRSVLYRALDGSKQKSTLDVDDESVNVVVSSFSYMSSSRRRESLYVGIEPEILIGVKLDHINFGSNRVNLYS
jgi:hypothetical protein